MACILSGNPIYMRWQRWLPALLYFVNVAVKSGLFPKLLRYVEAAGLYPTGPIWVMCTSMNQSLRLRKRKHLMEQAWSVAGQWRCGKIAFVHEKKLH